MLYLALKIFKFGASQAKKHKESKSQQQQQQQQQPNMPTENPPTNTTTTTNTTTYNPETDPRNPLKNFLETTLRFLQFVLGLAVIGLYGQDVHHSTSSTSSITTSNNPDSITGLVHPKCVYAVIVSTLATITALIYLLLPYVPKFGERPLSVRTGLHLPLFGWECVLFVLWLVLFGVFGGEYIGKGNGDGDHRVTRMKRAVWVDLADLVLWFLTGVWGFLRWWTKGRVFGGSSGGVVEDKVGV